MFDKKKSELLAKKIRKHSLEMTHLGNSSHIGSNLSIADILAVLYSSILHYNSDNLKSENRDRFILSKGHAGAALYATLAECSFMPLEKLKTHCQNGSDLSGHISHKGIPGVELSTGSLGHGLPVACGMALSAKINKKKHRVFALLSDGECDEGSNWEAILFASHHKLYNLTVIIDRNRLQSIYSTENTLALEPFTDKWKSFGWNVVQINGHNHNEIFQSCSNDRNSKTKPLCVIANTIKGKGVSFMENNTLWHYRSPQGEEYRLAMKELEKKGA
jgi:transketolase